MDSCDSRGRRRRSQPTGRQTGRLASFNPCPAGSLAGRRDQNSTGAAGQIRNLARSPGRPRGQISPWRASSRCKVGRSFARVWPADWLQPRLAARNPARILTDGSSVRQVLPAPRPSKGRSRRASKSLRGAPAARTQTRQTLSISARSSLARAAVNSSREFQQLARVSANAPTTLYSFFFSRNSFAAASVAAGSDSCA